LHKQQGQGLYLSSYFFTGEDMTNEIIVEMAIEGHSSTRDAIRWAMAQEREACAKIVDENLRFENYLSEIIRARGTHD
jgi:hypothetical protein